jgi:hypothetical protein
MVTMNNRDVSSFLLRGLLLALLAATTLATVSKGKGMTKKMSSKKGMMRMKMKMLTNVCYLWGVPVYVYPVSLYIYDVLRSDIAYGKSVLVYMLGCIA